MKIKDILNTTAGNGYLTEDSYPVHGLSARTHDGVLVGTNGSSPKNSKAQVVEMMLAPTKAL
jgi:hypothetical protein